MRRLYILLASALIAATLIALGGSPASGKSGHTKQYTALAFSPSAVISSVGDGSTLKSAEKKAGNQCLSVTYGDPNYRGDCQTSGWVQNGWIAVGYEGTLEGPPYNPQWNWGYGRTRTEAINSAAYNCQQVAAEPCQRERLERTRYYNPAMPTYGGNW